MAGRDRERPKFRRNPRKTEEVGASLPTQIFERHLRAGQGLPPQRGPGTRRNPLILRYLFYINRWFTFVATKYEVYFTVGVAYIISPYLRRR